MNLPNLLIVGAQKAGTTSLYDILKKNQAFYLPVKEIKFFHRDEHYSKGLKWYADHFKNYNGQRYIGDFTPDYMAYNWSAQRIYDSLGSNVKIIFILRQPVLRAYSQFNFHKMLDVEKNKSFEKTIKTESIDLEQNTFKNWYTPANYISRSIYTPQIERFSKLFGKESIHIVIFEELFIQKNEKAILQLENFLELPLPNLREDRTKSNSSQIPKNQNIKATFNQVKQLLRPLKSIIKSFRLTKQLQLYNEKLEKSLSKKPSKLNNETVKGLTNKYFTEDIKKLECFLGREIKVWK